MTKDGEVADNTLRDSADAFLGIPFKTDFVVDYVAERGYFGVLDDWQQKWPIEWGKIPLEDIWHPSIKMNQT